MFRAYAVLRAVFVTADVQAAAAAAAASAAAADTSMHRDVARPAASRGRRDQHH